MKNLRKACGVAWLVIGACVFGLALSNAMANQVPLCPTEDSVGCYWDAQQQGNGLGQSFVVDNSGNVTYVD